jgi:hypothetical protein
MKALLKFLYFIVFLIIIILLAGIFIPKSATFESKVNINANPSLVFDQINKLKNWENWLPILLNDSLQNPEYEQQITGQGAICRWNSPKARRVVVTIEEMEENKSVKGNIDLGNFGLVSCLFSVMEEQSGSHLKLDYSINDIGYFERYFILLFKPKVQENLDFALRKIKTVSEELRLSRISEPEIVETRSMVIMAILDTAESKNFIAERDKCIGRIKSYLEKRNMETAGDPVTIYFSRDGKGNVWYATGYCIPLRTWGWKEYVCLEIKEGKAATVTHWGDLTSNKPFNALTAFIKQNSMVADTFCWETVQVSAQNTPDTSLWQKQLFYPVKQD